LPGNGTRSTARYRRTYHGQVDTPSRGGRVLAVSDLHAAYPGDRTWIEQLRPGSDDDWLIVRGGPAHFPRVILPRESQP
jgi:hypothetical protein